MTERKLTDLRNFFRGKGLTQIDIADKLGVSRVVVSRLMTGKEPFGKSRAIKWGNAFNLNPMWLMTGEGNMIAESESNGIRISPTVYFAPLVGKYAYAGFTAGWGDEQYIDSLPKYPFFVDHDPHGNYFAVEVKGDSMDDGTDRSIKDGSIVLCRQIPADNYKDALLHINKWVFVVATSDGILIKRIKEHNIESGYITVQSYNASYPDQRIYINDIKMVCNVVQITHTPTL